jgi:predicted ATPase
MQLLSALGWQQMSGVPVPGGTPSWRTVLEIAEEIGDVDHQLRALWALWVDCKNTGVPQEGLAIAERFSALAVSAGHPSDRFIGDRLRGVSLHLLGKHTEARASIERMLDHYAPPADRAQTICFQFDQHAMARNSLARISWVEGRPGRALREVRDNIQYTIDIGHQLSLTNVLAEAGCPVAFLTGDLDLCERYTELLRDHAQAQALDVWNSFAECFGGDLLIRRGKVSAGLALLNTGIEKLRRINFVFHHTAFLSALASGLAKAGQPERGQAAIDEALAQCTRTGEAWFLPELHRLKGEIALMATGSTPEAEAAFIQALGVARAQRASSWELRAGTSLSKYWLAAGRSDEARALLGPIHQNFSKDHDTPDLQAAAAVLEAC